MHKLIEYVCDELDELERKVDKEGKLSMAEIEYADTLAHFKKNLLKSEEMYEDEYSGNYGRYYNDGMDGRSYARGRTGNVRRDSMGRYSSRGYSRDHEMVSELRELMEKAPDEKTRMEFQKFISKVESM